MAAWEVERMVIMFQEERLKMSQRILFTKQSPDMVFAVTKVTAIKLNVLQFGKFINQSFVNDKLLIPIPSGGLELVLPYPRLQEVSHFEMRITEQRRFTRNRSYHLRIKRTATVTDKHSWMLLVTYFLNKTQ